MDMCRSRPKYHRQRSLLLSSLRYTYSEQVEALIVFSRFYLLSSGPRETEQTTVSGIIQSGASLGPYVAKLISFELL